MSSNRNINLTIYRLFHLPQLELSNECDFDFDENLEKNKYELLKLEKQLDLAYDRLKMIKRKVDLYKGWSVSHILF